MFYACDYSTKPNMTCAPLMVAIRDGVRRLEEQLQQEEEEARGAEIAESLGLAVTVEKGGGGTQGLTTSRRRPLTKIEDEARRRLIRQATAANQAIVKGNCLMVMQMLTRREVLRSHFPWRLMMKHAVWMAFQHRREMQGFDEREQTEEVVVNIAEAVPEEDESLDGGSTSTSNESEEEESTGSHAEGTRVADGGCVTELQHSPGLCHRSSTKQIASVVLPAVSSGARQPDVADTDGDCTGANMPNSNHEARRQNWRG